MPGIVYTLWIVVLAVALLLFPFIVRLLHKTLIAAKNIERYLREMKEAGLGIAGNTGHITALDSTIEVATDILGSAGKINNNAETIKVTLADRAAKFN
jgi:tartrate dehydratase alpha subunit/fumarate hydratase class I-like protein